MQPPSKKPRKGHKLKEKVKIACAIEELYNRLDPILGYEQRKNLAADYATLNLPFVTKKKAKQWKDAFTSQGIRNVSVIHRLDAPLNLKQRKARKPVGKSFRIMVKEF